MNNKIHKHIQATALLTLGIVLLLCTTYSALVSLALLLLLPIGIIQLIGSFYFGIIKKNNYMRWHFILSLLVLLLFPLADTINWDSSFLPIMGLSVSLAISYWVQTFRGIKYVKHHNVLDLE
jgi:predicted ferric reductase